MKLMRNEVKTNWLFIIYQGKSLADPLAEHTNGKSSPGIGLLNALFPGSGSITPDASAKITKFYTHNGKK